MSRRRLLVSPYLLPSWQCFEPNLRVIKINEAVRAIDWGQVHEYWPPKVSIDGVHLYSSDSLVRPRGHWL